MGVDDRKAAALRALGLLDLTSLGGIDSEDDIRKLCGKARTRHGDVAAVCVWPRFAALAAGLLKGTGIRTAAVANFPGGGSDIDKAVRDTARIVEAGGDEVDVVFPYDAFLDGNKDAPAGLVAACKQACGADARLKVILETGRLPDGASIKRATAIALENGADFIKTSTGMVRVSATPEAARAILQALADSGSGAGFKASGGIKDLAAATHYLDLADEIMGSGWVSADTFRFGASGLLKNLLAVLDGTSTAPGSGY